MSLRGKKFDNGKQQWIKEEKSLIIENNNKFQKKEYANKK